MDAVKCTRCGKTKPAEAFRVLNTGRRVRRCKDCAARDVVSRRRPEAVAKKKEHNAAYYNRHIRGKCSEHYQKYKKAYKTASRNYVNRRREQDAVAPALPASSA